MSKPRKPLKKADELLLWVSSGGICTFEGCEQRLVFEEAGKTLNLADKAHVIPHGEGPRADERDKYNLSNDEVEGINNLILFCKNHHKHVDDHSKAFTAEVLYALKQKHEEWVQMRLNTAKISVAILHKTKGPPADAIMLASNLNLKVLGLASFQEDFDNVEQVDWEYSRQKTIEMYEEAMNLLNQFDGTLFTVFPLSQIPLLIQLGNLITDTIPTQVFQYNRKTGDWVLQAPIGAEVKPLHLEREFTERGSKSLVISLGVSSSINYEDIGALVPLVELDFLEITVDDPIRDRVLYKEDVDKVRDCFRSDLERLMQKYRYETIHLFYAGPAGLAVELGKSINRKMCCPVQLYQYNVRTNPRYELAFPI